MCMNMILLYILLAFAIIYMAKTPSFTIKYNPEIHHPASL